MPSMSSFKRTTTVDVGEYTTYGSPDIKVEMSSIDSKEVNFTLLLDNAGFSDVVDIDFIMRNLHGLAERMSPLLLYDDDVKLFGNSQFAIVALKDINHDHVVGHSEDDVHFSVNCKAVIITDHDYNRGQFPIVSTRRTTQELYENLDSVSRVGLPKPADNRVFTATPTVTETRNGTPIVTIADSQTGGFVDDTDKTDEAYIGRVHFDIHAKDMKFLENAVKVYDRATMGRVFHTHYEPEGNIIVENELYQLEIHQLEENVNYSGLVTIRAKPTATTVNPAPIVGMRNLFVYRADITWNQDESVIIVTDANVTIEVARGKEPIFTVPPNLPVQVSNWNNQNLINIPG